MLSLQDPDFGIWHAVDAFSGTAMLCCLCKSQANGASEAACPQCTERLNTRKPGGSQKNITSASPPSLAQEEAVARAESSKSSSPNVEPIAAALREKMVAGNRIFISPKGSPVLHQESEGSEAQAEEDHVSSAQGNPYDCDISQHSLRCFCFL